MFNIKALDRVASHTIKTMKDSIRDIKEIAAGALTEEQQLRLELETVKNQLSTVISAVDELEAQEKVARAQLISVSKEFVHHNEKDIQKSYSLAYQLQLSLIGLRKQEESLQKQRNILERSLRILKETQRRAEKLDTQVSAALSFLLGDFENLEKQFAKAGYALTMRRSIIEAMELERQRLAREIHDGPIQAVNRLVMGLDLCSHLWNESPEKLPAEFNVLQEIGRDCLKEMRGVVMDLRPMVLDDFGLLPAINMLVEENTKASGIKTNLVISGEVKGLPEPFETALFRILQEALCNIRRHSEANKVDISISFHRDAVLISIVDDGRGFILQDDMDKHDQFGIMGMQERVALLGGQFEIKSKPGLGTTIDLMVPIR